MKNILSLKITAGLILAIVAGSWAKSQTPFSLEPIQNAMAYLESNQRFDGALCDGQNSTFDVWETINSLRAIVLWAGETGYDVGPLAKQALHFLKDSENQNGMVTYNHVHRGEYCMKTSAEYVCLLRSVYPEEASNTAKKIEYIKAQFVLCH